MTVCRISLLTSLSLLMTACSNDTSPPPVVGKSDIREQQTTTDDAYLFCGGETTRDRVVKFFEDLDLTLSNDEGPEKFHRFMAPSFSVNREGRNLRYNVSDFNSVTPHFLGYEDWQQISERGLTEMTSGGWRGCFFQNGKVWVDGYGEDGLLLKAINHDMSWSD